MSCRKTEQLLPTLVASFFFACFVTVSQEVTAAVAVGVEFADAQDPFGESDGHVGVNWGGSPVPVGPNPLLGPWTKTFLLSSPDSSEPDTTRVEESLRFVSPSSGPFFPVVEWHEEILTPGFVWLDGEMEQLELSAIPIQMIATGTASGSSIRFNFPATPIVNDDFIYRITKRFAWVGTGERPAEIVISEYPAVVPEPSVWLMLMGGAALGLARRRRGSSPVSSPS